MTQTGADRSQHSLAAGPTRSVDSHSQSQSASCPRASYLLETTDAHCPPSPMPLVVSTSTCCVSSSLTPTPQRYHASLSPSLEHHGAASCFAGPAGHPGPRPLRRRRLSPHPLRQAHLLHPPSLLPTRRPCGLRPLRRRHAGRPPSDSLGGRRRPSARKRAWILRGVCRGPYDPADGVCDAAAHQQPLARLLPQAHRHTRRLPQLPHIRHALRLSPHPGLPQAAGLRRAPRPAGWRSSCRCRQPG